MCTHTYATHAHAYERENRLSTNQIARENHTMWRQSADVTSTFQLIDQQAIKTH